MRKNLAIVLCGLLIALQVALGRMFAIDVVFMRISLVFIPIALGGAIFGPFWNGLLCVAADIAGFMLVPSQGPFFPGFTLSAFLTGFAYGFFLCAPMPAVLTGINRAIRSNAEPTAYERIPAELSKKLTGSERSLEERSAVECSSGERSPGKCASGERSPGKCASGERTHEERPSVEFSSVERLSGERSQLSSSSEWLSAANSPFFSAFTRLSTARSLLVRTLLAAFCVTVLIDALLNTYWVSILYEKAYLFYFGARMLKSLAMLPLHVIIFSAIWRPFGKYIQSALYQKRYNHG